jgi:hypothetical protein
MALVTRLFEGAGEVAKGVVNNRHFNSHTLSNLAYSFAQVGGV